MKKGIAIGLGLLLLAGALWAQDDFAARLAVALQQSGWTEDAAQLMVRQQAQWGLAEGADPRAVAYALRYALRNAAAGFQMRAQEQARLAVEVALGLKEMNALGIQNRAAVRTMLQAMRQVLAEAGSAQEAGALLRLRLRTQLRLAIGDQTRQRLREQDQDRLRDRPEDMVPGGPSSGHQWSGPGGRI
jgi:hypothetical protein